MSISINEIKRCFRYNGVLLPDVPGLEPREVRDLYSAQYPELVSAEIEPGDIVDGMQEFTFRKAVGTKGASRRAGPRLTALTAAVQAQVDGSARAADDQLVKALARSGVTRCARAWSTFAQHVFIAHPRERTPARITPPSEALAPLP